MDSILSVRNISVKYQTSRGWFPAVSGVNFSVKKDEVFGIVGESGSGKSTLCMGLLKLLPTSAQVEVDSILFDDRELSGIKEEELRRVRWEGISYIPQSAMNTLNPVKRIRAHFYETITDHEGKKSKAELERRTYEALKRVHLETSVADQYAHELSGGMKQRVCIAMSTLLNPKLIIADEPTSALDVISQRTVLEILSKVRKSTSASMILIGHDMALQAQIADRMGVMFAGYFVEIGEVKDIFRNPIHPYTQRLIRSIPSIRQKENIHDLASDELSPEELERFKTPRPLIEAEKGHFVAEFK
ncbi:MAG: ABC transporter ATP-binding protein [Clostridiaceae bacterium]|jgi:peptide/nickel transport system ATP-binding protein|nr:ABC transporter ATP-binding protein [Clostridiaceae bacterium]NLW03172.1 ABC transporter ATP-binding protein [Clostridiaceae bacterium]